jgi:hypothetical protein
MVKLTNSFKCVFCGKLYHTECSAVKHEAKCFSNPARKACQSCGFDYCQGKPASNCSDYFPADLLEECLEDFDVKKVIRMEDLYRWAKTNKRRLI